MLKHLHTLHPQQQLVQAAQAGDTKTIEIDNGADLKDGTYKLEEKNYSNGYRTIFSMTVAGGKITESNFDMVDKDGKSKKMMRTTKRI